MLSSKTAALSIPILPHTSPEAPQPRGLILPLHSHQLRALHRCLVIENDGSLLSEGFHDKYDYKSKGGVLADAVGTGKTATSIGLILSGQEGNGGDTLVVAPSHLLMQWCDEIRKFASPNAIQVLVGKQEYEQKATLPTPSGTRRVVLVDIAEVLNEPRVWYDFRRVFDSERGAQLRVSRQDMEKYIQAAKACVRSPKGPCSYEGWVYTGTLHHPFRPWRRVICDEIQDLVSSGSESQKNLLQLSRSAPHVWLLSATPFPHGNASVYANHELLGFCRMRMDVEVSRKLPSDHPFEKIKRKLYIKSPRHVAESAVEATKLVVKNTLPVKQMQAETIFYEMELKRIREEEPNAPMDNFFASTFAPLREMTVHPEASQELREQAMGKPNGNNKNASNCVGQFSSIGSFATVSLSRAKTRQQELSLSIQKSKQTLYATKKSLQLAEKVRATRNIPMTSNPFEGPSVSDIALKTQLERKTIHDFYCGCRQLGGIRCRAQWDFRIIPEVSGGNEWIRGSAVQVVKFFQDFCRKGKKVTHGNGTIEALEHYISIMNATITHKEKALADMEAELSVVRTRVQMLGGTISANTTAREHDLLASTHGSKPAALVRFLRDIHAKGEQAIVFSYWHDTLRLVQRTLQRCQLPSSFCDGTKMAQALVDFTSGKVPFLLLSAQAKASGANLQCATHVILLDPAGDSAKHGAALEQQAIGRAVRMGQSKPVTVTRFCVEGTMEQDLFQEIDAAALQSLANANDLTYEIEGAHIELPVVPESSADNTKGAVADDDDVEVTESLTLTERIQREFVQAQEGGLVVDLLESDDENEPTERKQPPPKSTTTTIGSIAVKTEPTMGVNKRSSPEVFVDDTEDVSPPKRARSNENGTIAASASPFAAEFVTLEQAFAVSPSISQDFSAVEVTPGGVSPANAGDAMAGVKQLLERCKLGEYETIFCKKGYSCLERLYKISHSAKVMELLAADVGFEAKEAIRFQQALCQQAAAATST